MIKLLQAIPDIGVATPESDRRAFLGMRVKKCEGAAIIDGLGTPDHNGRRTKASKSKRNRPPGKCHGWRCRCTASPLPTCVTQHVACGMAPGPIGN